MVQAWRRVGAVGALLSLSLLLGCGAPGGQFPTSLPTTPPSSPSSSTLTPATPVPTPVPTPVSLPSFQAGINLLFYENTDYASQLPPLMAELHKDQINSVALTFPFYQAGLTSTTMVAGSGTPPENQLTTIISSLEENGFSVMLRPLLDETDLAPRWRGMLQPSSVAAWFASYAAFLAPYATLAANLKVQVFDIGTELYSLEPYTQDWTTLISKIKSLYTGAITYSINGNSEVPGTPYTGFWKALNFISVDAYWDLDVSNDSSTSVMANSLEWFLNQINQAAAGVPVVISEVGIVPQVGQQNQPWAGESPGPTSPIFQETYYNAVCSAVGATGVTGIYWWETNFGTASEFDPLGQPAEEAVQGCFTGR